MNDVRYAPEFALPKLAFVPGVTPRPSDDELFRGDEFEFVDSARWRENRRYLFGVDCYNRAFFWEAHEAWEGPWRAAEDDELQREFLQGLIQCSAACLKLAMREPAGFAALAEHGAAKLEFVAHFSSALFMGLSAHEFVRDFRRFVADRPSSSDARPRITLDLAR